MNRRRLLFGGLMSGTSLDGVDAILLAIEGDDPTALRWEVVGYRSDPYGREERERILEVLSGGPLTELVRLDVALAERFHETFSSLLAQAGVPAAEVTAIGSHGQTVWHQPPDGGERGRTLQIGDPATLAEASGCAVVSDFRSRDMAAGGHGAPLVPWCDWVLLRRPGTGRALQNLGGMGNVTYLPADGRVDGVRAFDTGPGVALLDGVARLASGGAEFWDHDGERAARGRVLPELLEELLGDPFFHEPPPRSTGRERFGDARLRELVRGVRPDSAADWDDLLATLTLLTARSVARSYERFLPSGEVDEVVLTGGGARNPTLVRAIEEELAPIPVRTGPEALGMDPDAREAAAFALLAWAHLRRIPGNLPSVTGAAGPRVLGSLTPGDGEGTEGGRR